MLRIGAFKSKALSSGEFHCFCEQLSEKVVQSASSACSSSSSHAMNINEQFTPYSIHDDSWSEYILYKLCHLNIRPCPSFNEQNTSIILTLHEFSLSLPQHILRYLRSMAPVAGVPPMLSAGLVAAHRAAANVSLTSGLVPKHSSVHEKWA